MGLAEMVFAAIPARHPHEEEDAHRLIAEDHIGIREVKAFQPIGQRRAAIIQPALPLRLPLVQHQLVVQPVDQRVLGWKILIEQRLSDAEVVGQVTCRGAESGAGKEGDRSLYDHLLPLVRRQAAALRQGRRWGRIKAGGQRLSRGHETPCNGNRRAV